MTGSVRAASRGRRPAARAVAAAAALTLGLTACASGQPSGGHAGASAGPVTVLHGDDPLSTAAAAVVARHLRERGHTVVDAPADDATDRPWTRAGGGTVAVVDTLRVALAEAPTTVLPDLPRPTPTASATGPSPSAAATSLPPLDPAAPPRVPADPSATLPSRTALPSASGAVDADGARRTVEGLLAGTLPSATAPGSASASRPQPARSASPSPSGATTQVLSSSKGALRLAAVVTAGTAARLELDSIDDLNQRCEALTLAVPSALDPSAHAEVADRLRERLDRLAGCRPAAWHAAAQTPAADVVTDAAQVGLAYRTDPDVRANALTALEDGGRVLPEGRLAVLGEQARLDDDAQDAMRDVMDALDEDGLRELARLTTGPDALPEEEAAQYWLVTRGLEKAPEGWFMPKTSWF